MLQYMGEKLQPVMQDTGDAGAAVQVLHAFRLDSRFTCSPAAAVLILPHGPQIILNSKSQDAPFLYIALAVAEMTEKVAQNKVSPVKIHRLQWCDSLPANAPTQGSRKPGDDCGRCGEAARRHLPSVLFCVQDADEQFRFRAQA